MVCEPEYMNMGPLYYRSSAVPDEASILAVDSKGLLEKWGNRLKFRSTQQIDNILQLSVQL